MGSTSSHQSLRFLEMGKMTDDCLEMTLGEMIVSISGGNLSWLLLLRTSELGGRGNQISRKLFKKHAEWNISIEILLQFIDSINEVILKRPIWILLFRCVRKVVLKLNCFVNSTQIHLINVKICYWRNKINFNRLLRHSPTLLFLVFLIFLIFSLS